MREGKLAGFYILLIIFLVVWSTFLTVQIENLKKTDIELANIDYKFFKVIKFILSRNNTYKTWGF